jgi:hypothetical protein
MKRPRIAAPAILAAIVAATTHLLAADAPAPHSPNDPIAEQTLRQARESLARARRLDIDCLFSEVDHYFEIEDLYQVKCYLEPSAGYFQELRRVDVSGKTSRAQTRSGRAYRLRSRPPERSLYANGQLTEIDDVERTYGMPKCAPGDPLAKRIGELDRPAVFAATIIPLGLNWNSEWDVFRKWYRIEPSSATPTTISISLAMRPESEGYDKDHPRREEVLLDRKTLLPITWRRTYGDSDLLITYRRFDLSPPPRELKVSLTGYTKIEITTGFVMPPPRDANAPSKPASATSRRSRIVITDEDQGDTMTAYLSLSRATICALRLVHLF